MTSKLKKRKIFIPKGVKIRQCSVRLGQINRLLSNLNSLTRKTYGKSSGPSKLIRVKNDLFKNTSTPLRSSDKSNERASKRTPKPNRRYVNDETINSTTWKENNVTSEDEFHPDQDDDDDDVDSNEYRVKTPQTEPSRRLRGSTITAPKTVGAIDKKSSIEKGSLTSKRKIDYDSDDKRGSKQQKKDGTESDTDSDNLLVEAKGPQRRYKFSKSSQSKTITKAPTKQINNRSRPLIKLPPTTKQRSSPIKTPPATNNSSTKQLKSKELSPIAKPNMVVDLEDFEQMPTFTIVNINDIINQKEEVVVIEKSPKSSGKKVKKITQKKDTEKDDVLHDIDADSIDDEELFTKSNKTISDSKSTSRRKTPHTVLSDHVLQSSAKNPTKTVAAKPTTAINKPYRNIIGGKNNGKLKEVASPTKPPPRILNSQLCTNVKSDVTSVVAKIASPKKTLNNNTVKSVLNQSKENLKQYDKSSPVTHLTTISGGRKVRKITCFETWFVIKLPNIEPTTSKSILDIELIQLGNEIKEIKLPTNDWNYKITLSRLTKPHPNGLIYCGEVQDATIKDDEKHFYQPTTIMFRRECKNKSLRMQFDRAVIFKNRNFFINVDGKNVKLIGAPQFIQNFEDIETLLQIVENLSLNDSLVEQTTYVI